MSQHVSCIDVNPLLALPFSTTMEVNARTLTRYSKTRNICIEEFIPLTADDSTLSRYSSIIKDYYEDSVPLTADDVRKRALLLNVDATEKPLRADVEEEALRRQLVGYVVVPWQNIVSS